MLLGTSTRFRRQIRLLLLSWSRKYFLWGNWWLFVSGYQISSVAFRWQMKLIWTVRGRHKFSQVVGCFSTHLVFVLVASLLPFWNWHGSRFGPKMVSEGISGHLNSKSFLESHAPGSHAHGTHTRNLVAWARLPGMRVWPARLLVTQLLSNLMAMALYCVNGLQVLLLQQWETCSHWIAKFSGKWCSLFC